MNIQDFINNFKTAKPETTIDKDSFTPGEAWLILRFKKELKNNSKSLLGGQINTLWSLHKPESNIIELHSGIEGLYTRGWVKMGENFDLVLTDTGEFEISNS